MSDFRFPQRVRGLREQMTQGQNPVDALLLTDIESVRYLTGFTGSKAVAVVTAGHALFLTDGRYLTQSATEVPGFERIILPQGTKMEAAAAEQVKRLGAARLGVEAGTLPWSAYTALRAALPEAVEVLPRDDAATALRMIKDADEVAKIRTAVEAVDACFDFIRQTAKVGMTEKELAWEIEVFLRRDRGAARLGFDSIIGAGPNSALIHGRAGDRKFGASGGPELLLCDYGCEIEGYNADITRTFVIGGTPTDDQLRLYNAVQKAQQRALDAIRPGKVGKEVHQVAVDSFTEDGYDQYFLHGLGHGLGRLVHDHLAFSAVSEVVLQAGMVVTVEPGAYIEGFGGCRIEDDVLITESGCEILTRATKELVVL
jgi:Xaa-Pro aminopeptidase